MPWQHRFLRAPREDPPPPPSAGNAAAEPGSDPSSHSADRSLRAPLRRLVDGRGA